MPPSQRGATREAETSASCSMWRGASWAAQELATSGSRCAGSVGRALRPVALLGSAPALAGALGLRRADTQPQPCAPPHPPSPFPSNRPRPFESTFLFESPSRPQSLSPPPPLPLKRRAVSPSLGGTIGGGHPHLPASEALADHLRLCEDGREGPPIARAKGATRHGGEAAPTGERSQLTAGRPQERHRTTHTAPDKDASLPAVTQALTDRRS